MTVTKHSLVCAIVLVVLVACSPRVHPTDVLPSEAMPSAVSSPTPAATPIDTISIACFLAIQGVLGDFQTLEAILRFYPSPYEGELRNQLQWLVDEGNDVRGHVSRAPRGCFSDDERDAHEALYEYLAKARTETIDAATIQELMTATGLPHPTPNF